MFINKHKWPDIVEDCANFLKIMENPKPCMVKFEENGTMKAKVYPDNCVIESQNRQPIMVITYDKYTFFANNGV